MRIINLSVLLAVMLSAPKAQAQGIQFRETSSWANTLSEAKRENKYLFVDAYATWCAPCKEMDKNIYPLPTIGDAMNSKFISVKVQIDQTKNDNDHISAWYEDAQKLKDKYEINTLPTYLFLSPQGELIGRESGAKNEADFLSLIRDITDPARQYQSMAGKYQQGVLAINSYPDLVRQARGLKQDSMAISVARNYMISYLEKLPEDQLYQPNPLRFYIENNGSINSNMKVFRFLLNHPAKFDSITNDKYAALITNYVINKEAIDPFLYPNHKLADDEPDWSVMETSIRTGFNNTLAKKISLEARLRWLSGHKRWEEYSKVLVIRVEEYGPFSGMGITDAGFNLNDHAWDLFQHSNDKNTLKQALIWSDRALALNNTPNWLDTKANLLYKLGKNREAIALEIKIINLAKGKYDPQLPEFEANLEKMKAGQPTWSVK